MVAGGGVGGGAVEGGWVGGGTVAGVLSHPAGRLKVSEPARSTTPLRAMDHDHVADSSSPPASWDSVADPSAPGAVSVAVADPKLTTTGWPSCTSIDENVIDARHAPVARSTQITSVDRSFAIAGPRRQGQRPHDHRRGQRGRARPTELRLFRRPLLRLRLLLRQEWPKYGTGRPEDEGTGFRFWSRSCRSEGQSRDRNGEGARADQRRATARRPSEDTTLAPAARTSWATARSFVTTTMGSVGG
jgi:hypothetical protein